jgi:hypothetical protein
MFNNLIFDTPIIKFMQDDQLLAPSILLDFWVKVTPGILQLVSHSKVTDKKNTILDYLTKERKKSKSIKYLKPVSLKGTLSRDFRSLVFLSHNSIWATNPRVRVVSYIDSNSPRYLTFKSNFWWSVVSMTPLTTGGRCQ